ncbi:putative ribonuclease H-like domain-containing protein [Tanacetum coccineum]
MSALKFADSHNMVAFLAKPTESDVFEQIVDFLNANPIKYALMLQVLEDGKKVIITKTSIRRDLQLEDAEGIKCLSNADIFEQLALMGYEKPSQKLSFYKAFFSPQWKFLIHTILQCLSAKSTAWNEFSSTMASAIIYLATNQKFNFSKCIFESMVKNVDSSVKFLMYPRFVQVFLDKQVGDMSTHDEIFVTPSHTKKVFGNMKRVGKGFFGAVTPLFPTMMVQAQKEMGEETIKITQAKEISSLKKRVKKLERKRKSKTPGMKRVFKIGRFAQVVSSEDEGLGNQEDASKQERKITNIDQNAKVTLVDETQQSEKVVKDAVSTAEVSATATITNEEITLAQALAELRSAKPKQEHEQAPTPIVSSQQPTQVKDKGKGKMVEEEPVKKMSKKELLKLDEELAFKLQAEEEKQARLARENAEKVKKANISWDNVQAMIEADRLLAERLQAREQEELTDEEKARLFVELLEKRKKNFVVLRAQEKRNKLPIKAQKKSTMSTYLKHMAGYKQSQLKNKSFAEIQKLFDKAMTRVNMFVDIDTELVKESSKKAKAEMAEESSSKRAREELEQEIHRKGRNGYYEIMRADGSAKTYLLFSQLLKEFDREDLENLWKLVKAKHRNTRPEEGYERVLWGDLNTMQSRKMSETTIASLRIRQENCILEAKVYQKWISKSVMDMKELAFYCILIDKQANMDVNNIDYFNPLVKPQMGAYRFSNFIFEKMNPYQQTLENKISLKSWKIIRIDILAGKESEFPEHHFEFVAYNQLASRVPYKDENSKMIYLLLTDSGNVVEFTMWDEGIRFTCEAIITRVKENKDWNYPSSSQCSKGSTQLSGTYTCEDHGKQDPPTYRYNFRAAVTDATATTQFTFFTNTGEKFTGHPCSELTQKYKGTTQQQLPTELVNIIGTILATSSLATTEESTGKDRDIPGATFSTSSSAPANDSNRKDKGIPRTPPHDIIEIILETIVSTIPRQKFETQPTKKDSPSAATPAEPKPSSTKRSFHTDLSLEDKKRKETESVIYGRTNMAESNVQLQLFPAFCFVKRNTSEIPLDSTSFNPALRSEAIKKIVSMGLVNLQCQVKTQRCDHFNRMIDEKFRISDVRLRGLEKRKERKEYL